MNDDFAEFNELTQEIQTLRDAYREVGDKLKPPSMGLVTIDAKEEIEDIDPNSLISQYSVFGGGFIPTAATVKTLSAGCYDVCSSQQGTYVVPTPPPVGLLLELPEMRSEHVLKLVDNFWASEKDYKEGNEFVIGGATYKCGIMLYGPPGSGKSCTIKLISRKLVERGGIVFFSSGSPQVTQDFLTSFSQIEKDRKCIVILEDIDSLINSYGESHFLEMLDSARTIDNVMFIATTNYPQRLDPRIYNRPGRFSSVIKIGLPTVDARRAYLKAILKNHRDVEYIVEHSSGFTIDHLTALINAVYREKKDLKEEMERLRNLFKIPNAEEEPKKIGFG